MIKDYLMKAPNPYKKSEELIKLKIA